MNITIDNESDGSVYVNLQGNCTDLESWHKVTYIVRRAAFETLEALKQAAIDFGEEAIDGDGSVEIWFYFRVGGPRSAQQALEILRDATRTALQAWEEFSKPRYWLPDSTETN